MRVTNKTNRNANESYMKSTAITTTCRFAKWSKAVAFSPAHASSMGSLWPAITMPFTSFPFSMRKSYHHQSR